MIIDLTMEITNMMPVYPGDDLVKLQETRNFDKDGYCNHRLETGMHIGTHLDGPMHMTDSELYISDVKLDNLIGKGILINCKNTDKIDYENKYEELIDERCIVLINTGYSNNFHSENYFKGHPVITEAFAELLIRKKVKAVCVDLPSPDRYPFDIHKKLLNRGIFIGENLVNLDKLESLMDFEIFIVPLNIRADGAMARIFARTL